VLIQKDTHFIWCISKSGVEPNQCLWMLMSMALSLRNLGAKLRLVGGKEKVQLSTPQFLIHLVPLSHLSN